MADYSRWDNLDDNSTSESESVFVDIDNPSGETPWDPLSADFKKEFIRL